MTARQDVTGRQCPVCHTNVAAAAFCGRCGAAAEVTPGQWDVLLRSRVFANAPRERLITPRVTSSLFPRLPRAARTPFRLALVLLLLAMVALSALRINAALGAIAV